MLVVLLVYAVGYGMMVYEISRLMVLRPCVSLVWKVVMAFGNGYVDGSTGFLWCLY